MEILKMKLHNGISCSTNICQSEDFEDGSYNRIYDAEIQTICTNPIPKNTLKIL